MRPFAEGNYVKMLFRLAATGSLLALVIAPVVVPLFAQQSATRVHGLWLWKTAAVLAAPDSAAQVRDFCREQGINEVYVSFSRAAGQDVGPQDARLADLIRTLHRSHIRAEALLSSTDADEPGRHRDKLLQHASAAIDFNRAHPGEAFDGIHLDIEPQQRPENKGPGNLNFLPNLLETFAAVERLAVSAHLTVNADIQNKLLKGSLEQRRALLTSLPRFTLMLYELSSPADGQTTEQQEAKLRGAAENFLKMAYQGLPDAGLAKIAMGLRTPDYEEQLPHVLKALDEALGGDPEYLGWAWHSWNDHAGGRE